MSQDKLDFAADVLKQVLVIDDNIDMTRLVCMQLQPQGFECIQKHSVKEAKEVLHKFLPAIIICDWKMPKEDGLMFCKEIKTNPATSHIYFIMLTASNDSVEKETALLNGVDDYITKPFDTQELISRINIAYRVCLLQKIAFEHERNKAFTQMGNTIAHEINNPLTGLIGFLQLTKSRLEKKNTLHHNDILKTVQSLERCLEQSHRIKNVVQKIKDVHQPKFKMHGSTQIVDIDPKKDVQKN